MIAIYNPGPKYQAFKAISSEKFLKAFKFFAGQDGQLSLTEARQASRTLNRFGLKNWGTAFSNIALALQSGDTSIDTNGNQKLSLREASNLTRLGGTAGKKTLDTQDFYGRNTYPSTPFQPPQELVDRIGYEGLETDLKNGNNLIFRGLTNDMDYSQNPATQINASIEVNHPENQWQPLWGDPLINTLNLKSNGSSLKIGLDEDGMLMITKDGELIDLEDLPQYGGGGSGLQVGGARVFMDNGKVILEVGNQAFEVDAESVATAPSNPMLPANGQADTLRIRETARIIVN